MAVLKNVKLVLDKDVASSPPLDANRIAHRTANPTANPGGNRTARLERCAGETARPIKAITMPFAITAALLGAVCQAEAVLEGLGPGRGVWGTASPESVSLDPARLETAAAALASAAPVR